VDWWIDGFMEYTKRRNLNRGFMKLEVWQRGMDLFELAFRLAAPGHDFKLKSQFTDAAQSVPANISEGYGRRTLPEYIQFLYVAKGSLAEALTRGAGFWRVKLVSDPDFETFDTLHYEVENKLLALIVSLESKLANHDWRTTLARPKNPPIQ
jgi:four helix bundle protein